jgi:Lar family restriction alleviation protein
MNHKLISLCPFCGKRAKLTYDYSKYGRDNYVECLFCEAKGPLFEPENETSSGESVAEQKAIEAWNLRPRSD